jgi:DNA gyrase subunit A
LVNLLPLAQGETISTCMALPEDEESWAEMFVMFATSAGTVRRNRLSDFTHIMANGKIAMKLEDEGARLVSVQTCGEDDDVLLATARGKCIRFPIGDVRVFSGRTSTGVRGIALAEGDEVISMSILHHIAVETEERDAYLRAANAKRRLDSGERSGEDRDPERRARDAELAARLAEPKFMTMGGDEQFVLSVASDGLGKRTSAYDYRITGRGGQGIDNMDLSRGDGAQTARVVAAFPVADDDEIMLVTDRGQLIRCPVERIPFQSRKSRGVIIIAVDDGERVVSVARLEDVEDNGGPNGGAGADAAGENGAGEA